jgi:hypothetical protein
VIIGGLTVGTVLALFVVPVIHTYTDDLARFVRSGVWRLTAGRKSSAEEGTR